MFSRLAYILRETAANLTRNLTLTIASLLTVIVSLSFVGFVFLIQDAVTNQLFEWKDGVEISIFMTADASDDQIAAVQRDLDQNTLVKESRFVDKEEAKNEIKKLFPNTPEIVDITKTADVPTSFRVKPSSTDSTVISAITNQFTKDLESSWSGRPTKPSPSSERSPALPGGVWAWVRSACCARRCC